MLTGEDFVGLSEKAFSSIGVDFETQSKRVLFDIYHKKGYEWCKDEDVVFKFDKLVFFKSQEVYDEKQAERSLDVAITKCIAFVAGVCDQLNERKVNNNKEKE